MAASMLLAGPLGAQPAHTPSVADFSWLQGFWSAADGAARLEQYWSPPLGDTVVGVQRRTAQGRDPLFELAVLRAAPSGVELRSRRFGKRLQPVGGTEPIVLTLIAAEA